MDVGIVVDSVWLGEHLEDSDICVVDVRPPHFYEQGHIPGALNIPIFLVVGPGGMPQEPGDLARRLGEAGISRDSHVVAYDDGESPNAATLFRVLCYYSHPKASVLDGGITVWAHQEMPLTSRQPAPTPLLYDIGDVDGSTHVQTDDVVKAIESGDAAIVDTRHPGEYLGDRITASRDGHIPTAINIEWSNNLVPGHDGLYRLRSDDELSDVYAHAGVTPDKSVIVYCQSGNRASETFLVLRKLGYPSVRCYAAGWQEWGNRPDLPVEE